MLHCTVDKFPCWAKKSIRVDEKYVVIILNCIYHHLHFKLPSLPWPVSFKASCCCSFPHSAAELHFWAGNIAVIKTSRDCWIAELPLLQSKILKSVCIKQSGQSLLVPGRMYYACYTLTKFNETIPAQNNIFLCISKNTMTNNLLTLLIYLIWIVQWEYCFAEHWEKTNQNKQQQQKKAECKPSSWLCSFKG